MLHDLTALICCACSQMSGQNKQPPDYPSPVRGPPNHPDQILGTHNQQPPPADTPHPVPPVVDGHTLTDDQCARLLIAADPANGTSGLMEFAAQVKAVTANTEAAAAQRLSETKFTNESVVWTAFAAHIEQFHLPTRTDAVAPALGYQIDDHTWFDPELGVTGVINFEELATQQQLCQETLAALAAQPNY